MTIVVVVIVLSWAYRALTFTNRKGRKYIMNDIDAVRNSFSNVVLCGSVYGNECDKEYFEYLEYAY